MKLTKLHIFLILLIALVLCSCFGMCSTSTKEGYTSNKTYHSYDNYYNNLNDANISATDWSQGLDDTYNNPYYNKNDQFHKRYKNENKNYDYSYKDDDLNGGNNDDSSSYMISTSYKNNKNYDSYNKYNRRENSNNNMFDSVSNGAMNGSTYSYSGDNDGITQDQIPNGQEDLYILKTQSPLPICPACPPPPKVDCNDKCGKSKCPPCPPCARCPEPQFDCVKVPNYNTTNLDQNLPIPWMSKL